MGQDAKELFLNNVSVIGPRHDIRDRDKFPREIKQAIFTSTSKETAHRIYQRLQEANNKLRGSEVQIMFKLSKGMLAYMKIE